MSSKNEQKLEYSGAALGGGTLASNVPTFRYAAGALHEMRTLLASVRASPQPSATKLIFQTLPKHMRRRAMSHHPKRLPRRYRAAHCSQMAKAGRPHATRRPSRKCRRRPSNLLRAYVRRQRRHVWLETHIWHARRFHMQERWGYRLPYASCDKTYRAAYRASAQHCLLQDISYYGCLELCGTLAQLRAGFARLSGGGGLSIAARTYASGRREGSIALFRDGRYPEGALARCEFMWRPPTKEPNDAAATRTLWLWVHPSSYAAVLEELLKVFALASTKNVRVPLTAEEQEEKEKASPAAEAVSQKAAAAKKATASKTKNTKAQRQLQFMTKTQAFERVKRYTNVEQTLQLRELKDTLNRFRLTGPLSQAVLAQAFKAHPSPTTTVPAAATSASATSSWFQAAPLAQPDFLQQHATQSDYWRRCGALQTPAALMSNMILALNICDPRLQRPQKRTKASATPAGDGSAVDFLTQLPPDCLPQSAALWSSELRDRISDSMLTQHEYCELRRQHAAVPGAELAFEVATSSSSQLQPVPVLLIQRPGATQPQYKRLGYGCGWDVIAPAGYGMPIWLSLIMWGAKPGGLRESESIARELGTEEQLPDTVNGLQSAAERHAQLMARYFRLPPNKRCNYRKYAVVSPFRAPFAQLVRDWMPPAPPTNNAISVLSPATSSFHVLRDRALLQQLNECLFHNHNNSRFAFPALPAHCLVQLLLRMKTRGNPGGRGNEDDFTLVCLPTRTDLKRNLRQLKYENYEPVYTEPLRPDASEKERRCLRLQHKRLLKRLRARRVRIKRKQQETSTTRVHILPAETAPIVAAQLRHMCALWLPDEEPHCSTLFSVRKQCAREVFGYAAHAHFSYTEATVCAVGYVCGEGLRQLWMLAQQARLKQPMFLARGSRSRHYRFASFKLNLDV